MSFEGYFQLICKNGHYYHEGLYGDEENTKCPICKEECIWWNLVDTTNDEGTPVVPELLKRKSCKHCKTVLEEIYKIPKEGHLK